jgi:hypothetical protein
MLETLAILRVVDARKAGGMTCNTGLNPAGADTIPSHPALHPGRTNYPLRTVTSRELV